MERIMGHRVFIVLAATIVLASSLPAYADPGAGQTSFNKICANCHTNRPNKNNIVPTLFGLIGRKSGSAPGFSYSDAMKNAGITWDENTLSKYLADPKAFIPGNKMPYAGVKKPDEREDIIAYLSTLH
jgi:cytochrome c